VTVVFAFLLMLVIVAAMALGVMTGRKPIAGSCGGAKALGLDGGCACGRTPGSCESDGKGLQAIPKARAAAGALAVDAAASEPGGRRTL
jgi:hypothetical protein